MAIPPISPTNVVLQSPVYSAATQQIGVTPALDGGFTRLVSDGLKTVDTKVARADELITAFALGEPIPMHQVTIALEQARIAVELSVQVRERLTEAYRSFMSMQL